MHIHEIIIDGFKSYAQKTVVSGFDPHFNAITGLNGTGKSNILDSICFVLGISNLSQVRVGNLQELVYKQGQAGVTKASVTIVFNNSDASGSPVGYEQHKQITVTRQIVIGGKNKYMINGVTAQQSQVQNLFHSVQLNVNNPHFLIMQGRITKVLNMKPPEILSMIEEAAGTRMFETKKQAALKTIEKKQLKVDELTRVMDSDINPTLEKLKVDKQTYISWMSNNTELEQLERFCIAFDYSTALARVKSTEEEKKSLETNLQSLKDIQKQKESEISQFESEKKQIEMQMESESGVEFQQLKKNEQDISKDLVKLNALLNNEKDNLSNETEAKNTLSKQIQLTEKSLEDKKSELAKLAEVTAAKETESNNAESHVNALRERYQNALAGVTDENNSELLSLPEQVGAWEKRAREAMSQIQQGTIKANHNKQSIKELKKAAASEQAAYSKISKEADELRLKVAEAEETLKSLGVFTEEEEKSLLSSKEKMKSNLCSLRDEVENLSAQIQARIKFDYNDPEKGFNRSRVKGPVANLFSVKDSYASIALEISAGGKLSQIVVDNEITANALLKNGGLKKRITFLPLNKIDNRCTEASKVERAKQIAKSMGGSAYLALELISFDESVRSAMEHVFGTTLVCSSSAIASAVAYDPQVKNKTVTLEGDVISPVGTMSGGSKNSLGDLLIKISLFNKKSVELNKMNAEYNSIIESLKKMESLGAKAKDLTSTLNTRRNALERCESKLAASKYSQMMSDVDRMELELKSLEEESLTLKASHDRAQEELNKLKNTEKNIKSSREKVMKEMEAEVKTASKSATAVKNELLSIRHKRDVIVEEISALTKELNALREQFNISVKTIEKFLSDVESLSSKYNSKKEEYENAKAKVAAKQEELNRCSKEIKELDKAITKSSKAGNDAGLEAVKIQHKLKLYETDTKKFELRVKTLEKSHPWIDNEKLYFGQAGGNYDFTARNPEEAQKRLNDVKSAQDNISKKLNKKAIVLMEKAESEYQELSRKRDVILNDKAKIEAVIEELDIKKTQALQSTWVKVNRDFGSIFSTLLPGTFAKLEPLEGCSVMDGLQVKVSFNGVWKESLTELSGGQRSLLALSLILSLLLFKPAPMYILDEVDAALDLSHTQNIGLMLRTHFSTSQFIVVSLKEGMFNNANVIFRTKFVDGVSAVVRTVTGAAKSKAITNQENVQDENASPQKKRGKTTNQTKSKLAASSRQMIENII